MQPLFWTLASLQSMALNELFSFFKLIINIYVISIIHSVYRELSLALSIWIFFPHTVSRWLTIPCLLKLSGWLQLVPHGLFFSRGELRTVAPVLWLSYTAAGYTHTTIHEGLSHWKGRLVVLCCCILVTCWGNEMLKISFFPAQTSVLAARNESINWAWPLYY